MENDPHCDSPPETNRVVCWFSCGDASAVATSLALKKWPDAIIARIVIPNEHPDNDRFAADCSRWWGRPILELQDPQKRTVEQVWEQRQFIAGIAGAPCTGELKKEVRYAFQQPDDLHVFGFTCEPREMKRAKRLSETNFECAMSFPLIEHGLRKSECHAIVRATGIELAAMYKLGFGNNNCIGCPKGGAGYWNKIRQHFPEVFARRAEQSRRIGARLAVQDGQRIFLDELRPTTGRQKNEVEFDCSSFCEPALELLNIDTAK